MLNSSKGLVLVSEPSTGSDGAQSHSHWIFLVRSWALSNSAGIIADLFTLVSKRCCSVQSSDAGSRPVMGCRLGGGDDRAAMMRPRCRPHTHICSSEWIDATSRVLTAAPCSKTSEPNICVFARILIIVSVAKPYAHRPWSLRCGFNVSTAAVSRAETLISALMLRYSVDLHKARVWELPGMSACLTWKRLACQQICCNFFCSFFTKRSGWFLCF